MAKFKIDGMKELERTMKRLNKVPQTVATQSARAGASIALRAARSGSPVMDGDIKAGIIMKREKRVKIGKAVYDIMMDPAKTDIFAKVTKTGVRYYYPASMEHGFLTKDGGYVPGYHFLRKSLTNNVTSISKKVIEVAGKAIDKAMKG